MPKYNNKKVTEDGYTFDSKLENKYYRYLKLEVGAGKIKSFTLQPIFTLQEGFKKEGKAFRPITYIADFKVIHNDDTIEIIDIKGMETEVFNIKRKMFHYVYRDLKLSVLNHVVKFGGWISIEEYDKRKRQEKKKK